MEQLRFVLATGTRTYGFEATFLFSSLLFRAIGAQGFLTVLPPPCSSLPWVSGGNTVDILVLIVSLPGDASFGGCPCEATPFLGDAPSGQPVDIPSLRWGPQAVPPYVELDFDIRSTPRDGTIFIILTMTKVFCYKKKQE